MNGTLFKVVPVGSGSTNVIIQGGTVTENIALPISLFVAKNGASITTMNS